MASPKLGLIGNFRIVLLPGRRHPLAPFAPHSLLATRHSPPATRSPSPSATVSMHLSAFLAAATIAGVALPPARWYRPATNRNNAAELSQASTLPLFRYPATVPSKSFQ